MIKIKIKEKPNCVNNNLKCRNYSVLEGIVLLDTAINMLREDFELSDDEIWEFLKDYRTNWKEVE